MPIITGDKLQRYRIIQRSVDSGEVERLLMMYCTEKEQKYAKTWRRWNTSESLYNSLQVRMQLVEYFMSKNNWIRARAIRWVASKLSQRLKDRGYEGKDIYNIWSEGSP